MDTVKTSSGNLSFLGLYNVGPTDKIEIDFAPRLNIITGDNGIGKTFIMDCAWWALTSTWCDNIAMPKTYADIKDAKISYSLGGGSRVLTDFTKEGLLWHREDKESILNGTVIYSLVDNSYAIWDSKCNSSKPYILTDKQIWNGEEGVISGLIKDWLLWQSNPAKYPFEVFSNVLKAMSPPDMGTLYPGEPTQLPDAAGLIPTIVFPYGTVPVTYSSAGIRRILTLAYLIVWTWARHKVLCGEDDNESMTVLVDEIEAHIHPKWQRTLLTALMKIQSALSDNANVQFIISTHSPLVLASAEAVFEEERDKLFGVQLSEDRKNAVVNEIDFIRYGQINAWLTSPIFNLSQARSVEAENAIEAAKRLQLQDEPDKAEIQRVHELLVKYISQTDTFWPRWIFFAEEHGVKV